MLRGVGQPWEVTELALDEPRQNELLVRVVASGIAFRTSGCPGATRPDVSACDRPYGDSPPSDIASFPFQPEAGDIAAIRAQLGL